MSSISADEVKKDFPIFNRQVNGKKLVYLDNAASSQKPGQVLDALIDYYSNHNANVHRGLHTLSEEATEMYEKAREAVAGYIGASHAEEVIFTKGTTEALNRVAFEWGLEYVKKGDVILLTEVEHHSNLIPWQVAAQRTGASLDFVTVNAEGVLDPEDFKTKLDAGKGKVKLVALFQASNVTGQILPVKEICKWAHEAGAFVVVDGAQAVPHMPVNLQSLGCDFYAFSGHKMMGPMGIGVLWAKREILEKLEPYEYGGGMIDEVTFTSATWAKLPEKFEAGTPNAAGAIGLAAAVDYLRALGPDKIRQHAVDIGKYALSELAKINRVKILGPTDPAERSGLATFYIEGVHAHDVASVLSADGIAVRSGHHCTMPLHKKLNIPASLRASWYVYNSTEDIDTLIAGLHKAIKLLC